MASGAWDVLYFCFRWLDADEDDGKTERELFAADKPDDNEDQDKEDDNDEDDS